MKRFLILPLLICAGMSVPGTQDYPAGMKNALQNVQTLSCEFQQEREVSVLTEKGISRGRLVYKKDGGLLWQYNNPDRSGFLLRGNDITILDRSGNPVPDPGAGGFFRHIGKIILLGMSGEILEDSGNFTSEFVSSGDFIQVRLFPAQKDMKRMFTHMELFFRKEDHMIQTIVIYEVSGDKTTVRLGNIRFNLPIDDKIFDAYVSQQPLQDR
ncbi:MAG: outer membrane lipoprotein carrier protein LolA [Bacteroidales bacterium]|jgi:outer membrane lipoprotein-sorting protein|nr:outer membrane lipoprotein carrier protein LolA [Bacteroidales bacterium]MDD2264302.1 outer membrane lipoprotein carrier protein LolA [Bacteroidales bacterium]MDD2831536.1 outer membrane lipoprotein carrier protein LolA [Bacteroidales bacterium]MDD3208530.1 outer membrane lipoprotein carrier protein LolA [Bacteroidales bacterium]MDD3697057.1 outer membrane lipoprotein carrier protein LolA [Bacteroidales bacterium]